MEIRVLSPKRGIIALYNGEKYIIYSTYYGVVAESTKIDRHYDEATSREHSVTIEFDVCEWFGYWSLYDIIRRGVKKMERQFINDKEVCIILNQVRGEQNHLHRRLVMTTEEY